MVLDGPSDPLIAKMVDRGYIVRTRADSGLKPDAPGKPSRRDKAFASGAHIISTDFPTGEPHAETGYTVEFAGGAPARVNGPENLRGKTVAK